MSFYDDASLIMYPSGYKEDKIYSLKPTDGSGDLTFTRASTATRVNEQGLIEGVRTNLIRQSNTFSNASWVKSGATVTAGQTDPNGGTSASKIDLAAGGNSYIGQFSLGSGIKTNSIWLRADSAVEISFDNGQNANVITLTTSWARYTITQTGSAGAGVSLNNYLGVAVPQLAVSFYVFQAQNETGDIATEYIPTTTTAVSVGMTANVPRIDYTSGCGKLLLESQRTNLQVYSENFKNIAEGGLSNTWTPNDTIILSTNNTAPDGTLSATRIRGTSGANRARQAIIIGTSGAPYSGSIYIRRVSGTGNITLRVGDVGTAIGINPSSTWQRFSHTASPSTTTVRLGLVFPNDTDEFEIWGAQLEAGSYPTSYIPTLASSVTRLADEASKTGISSLIGQTEGVFFFEFDYKYGQINTDLFEASAGANDNIRLLALSDFNLRMYMFVGGVSQAAISTGTIPSEGRHKVAMAYKENDCAFYLDGVQIGVDTSCTIPAVEDIFLIVPNQDTRQVLIFKTRLTDTQLATLTTI